MNKQIQAQNATFTAHPSRPNWINTQQTQLEDTKTQPRA